MSFFLHHNLCFLQLEDSKKWPLWTQKQCSHCTCNRGEQCRGVIDANLFHCWPHETVEGNTLTSPSDWTPRRQHVFRWSHSNDYYMCILHLYYTYTCNSFECDVTQAIRQQQKSWQRKENQVTEFCSHELSVLLYHYKQCVNEYEVSSTCCLVMLIKYKTRQVVATFLVSVFVYMLVDTMNEEKRCLLG